MQYSQLYRALLLLYPAEFRQQFSTEMLGVFVQKASERFANGKRGAFAFLLTEFLSIVKGASIMWFTQLLTERRDTAGIETADATAAEVAQQRQTAISNMVTSIARHDFVNARRYSYEESRLKRRITELENEAGVERKMPA